MVDDNSQPPAEHRSKLRQILDIIADLLARQKDLASCIRQVDWDNRELRLRIEALERQAEAYRKKYPIDYNDL
jgi:hypothetical protein